MAPSKKVICNTNTRPLGTRRLSSRTSDSEPAHVATGGPAGASPGFRAAALLPGRAGASPARRPGRAGRSRAELGGSRTCLFLCLGLIACLCPCLLARFIVCELCLEGDKGICDTFSTARDPTRLRHAIQGPLRAAGRSCSQRPHRGQRRKKRDRPLLNSCSSFRKKKKVGARDMTQMCGP